MSTAFYPLGMSSYNNHLPQGGYQSWKGSGINSNPVGIASSNIRPLTNNDSAEDEDIPSFVVNYVLHQITSPDDSVIN